MSAAPHQSPVEARTKSSIIAKQPTMAQDWDDYLKNELYESDELEDSQVSCPEKERNPED